MLQILLASGPRKITVKSCSGQHILQLSNTPPDAEKISEILTQGTSVRIRVRKGRYTSREASALCWAARTGSETLIRLLLDKGADVAAKDQYGNTALHCAAAMNREGAVRLLLRGGAERYVLNRFQEKPLDRAKVYGHMDMIMLLLEDVDIEVSYQDGVTALQLAAIYPDDGVAAAAVRALLEKGASTSAMDYDETPVRLAILNGSKEVMRLLIDADLQRDQQPDFNSLFYLAITEDQDELASLLMEMAPEGTLPPLTQKVPSIPWTMDMPVDPTLLARLMGRGF